MHTEDQGYLDVIISVKTIDIIKQTTLIFRFKGFHSTSQLKKEEKNLKQKKKLNFSVLIFCYH